MSRKSSLRIDSLTSFRDSPICSGLTGASRERRSVSAASTEGKSSLIADKISGSRSRTAAWPESAAGLKAAAGFLTGASASMRYMARAATAASPVAAPGRKGTFPCCMKRFSQCREMKYSHPEAGRELSTEAAARPDRMSAWVRARTASGLRSFRPSPRPWIICREARIISRISGQQYSPVMIWDSFQSSRSTAFPVITPSPAEIRSMGACARMSMSAMTATGVRVANAFFSPLTISSEHAGIKPSVEGADKTAAHST